MRNKIRLGILLFLLIPGTTHVQASPNLTNTVEPFLIHKIVSFPDYADNYSKTVLIPAQQAASRAEQERLVQEAAQQVQTAYVAPTAPVGNCQSWMTGAGIVDPTNAYTLIMRESGCNPNSVNTSSGACGIGQQLPCGKWPHTWNDPIGGMIDMQNYVFATYSTWANALSHSYQFGWY